MLFPLHSTYAYSDILYTFYGRAGQNIFVFLRSERNSKKHSTEQNCMNKEK
jgi:hypothetical protein